jgi:aspartyl-tRNA synthetase
VIAGFDRYYQIAICFRDEDLRADRVQEITQLDVEMAFPDVEFVIGLMEEMCVEVWRECIDVELAPPFRRMTYAEAMVRYGTDKPDLRYGLEIEDATDVTRGSQFAVFASAPAVRLLRVPKVFSRAELDRLEARAKELGAGGLAYLVHAEDGQVRSPIAKFLSDDERVALLGEPGTTTLFGADEPDRVARVLGVLREELARELALIDEDAFELVWITDFPMFEWSEEDERWAARHHPFTRPEPEWEEGFDRDPGGAVAVAYDLVANGNEIGGGSLRIHEPELQARVFDVLRLSPEEQRVKFGFLLDALAMGAPPHGGIAFGIDRMLMVVAQEPNLRDVIAFPKNQAGVDPMSGAPSEVTPQQLEELGIRLVDPPEG